MTLRPHRLAVKQGERAQLQALFRKVEDPLAAGVLAKQRGHVVQGGVVCG
jgi:hypothetical protein